MNTNVYATINASAIKSTARTTTVNEVFDALVTAFGSDNVSMVGSGDIAVNTGYDKEGREVCTVVSVSAKDYFDRTTKSKTFTAFNRQAAAQAYAEKVLEAEQKKANAKTKREVKNSTSEVAKRKNEDSSSVETDVPWED
jgi:hypothetical protein